MPRQPVRLDAVADAKLADGLGQVVAHGAVRQVQAFGDLARGKAFAGEAQQLAFAVVQRVRFGPGAHRELRIDRAPAAMDRAQGLGQLRGRRVLEQVAADTCLERTAQETRPCERGEDHDLARKFVPLHALRQFQPGQARHFDVGDEHVGLGLLQQAPRFLAVGGLADHGDIGLEPEQRRQRTAHHRLVLGQQHTDHVANPSSHIDTRGL